jgi:nucleoside 2-deoxyribosyltransferase
LRPNLQALRLSIITSSLILSGLTVTAGCAAAAPESASSKPPDPIYLYLAGPGVFLPDATSYGTKRKRRIEALAAERNWPVTVRGLYPLDNAIENFAPDRDTGLRIYRANMAQIERADAVIANMVRFRSPSMDVGTAFEMGVARGSGKPVFGYYDAAPFYGAPEHGEVATGIDAPEFDLPDYRARVAEFYGLTGVTDRDPDGLTVESFQMTDNLMLLGALDDSRQDVAPSFDAAVIRAVEHVLASRQAARRSP